MASPVGIERPSSLSLDPAKPKSRVTFNETVESITHDKVQSTVSSRKFRCETEFRAKRKRTNSCSFSWDHLNSKRRRAAGTIILPTKFLLGGNITDPLNLEALDQGDDEKANVNSIGPGFRRGSTVRVIIPPNINDPLNLDACSDDGNEQLADAISKQRRRRKTRKRRRRNSEPTTITYENDSDNRLSTSLEEQTSVSAICKSPLHSITVSIKDDIAQSSITTDPTSVTATSTSSSTNNVVSPISRVTCDTGNNNKEKEKTPLINSAAQTSTSTPRQPQSKRQRTKSDDKIVSPVIPQPGVERKRHNSYQRQHSNEKPAVNSSQLNVTSSSQKNSKNICFQYGNYNQYYGYRNIEHKPDARLKVFQPEWFSGKQVLDIGCNIGHITLSIGKDFVPQRIVGVDIDRKLVNIAQKNIKHYLKSSQEESSEFPRSMRMLYGPLKPPVEKGGQRKFPYNVKFFQSNYVLENDSLLETVRPEFDVIICLSVTKWIHLNYGDEGLIRFFKRIFRNLLPGGMLILEPQGWPSYKKKRKLSDAIFENYKNIRLFPNKFGDFLTSEIGFSFCSKYSVSHYSKGFDRPIYIYKKILEKSPRSCVVSCGEVSLDNILREKGNGGPSNVDLSSSNVELEITRLSPEGQSYSQSTSPSTEKIAQNIEENSSYPDSLVSDSSKILSKCIQETDKAHLSPTCHTSDSVNEEISFSFVTSEKVNEEDKCFSETSEKQCGSDVR